MPGTNHSQRQQYSLSAAIAVVLVLLAGASTGCRVFRCQKASDDSIAAARQLSLAGIDAQQRGHWQRAESLFAAAILKCPTDERARCGFAESLWQRGARGEAISHMQEAVRLSGHDPERLVRLGQMHQALGETHVAQRHAELAIAANPQLASAWALQGQIELSRGQTSEALASFHRALSYEQPLPAVQLAISEIYLQQGRPQRALATIQALAATFSPGQVPDDVLLRESLALRALDRPQDAARSLADAAARGTASAELLYHLASCQQLAGETAAARQTVAAALSREPQHAACLALERQLSDRSASVAAALPASATSP